MKFDDTTGLPDCEPCCQHWWRDRPRTSNPTAYFTRFHALNHRSPA